MVPHFRQVAIIGVGLIGGSLGIVLKQRGLADAVVGAGRRIENLKIAQRLGAIDRFVAAADDVVEDSDLIVLATPVDTYARHLTTWGNRLRAGTIVSDVGSVKGDLVQQAEELLPPEVHFVGAHPIAGREKSGVAAASLTLFQGARCIVTPTKRTHPDSLGAIKAVWEQAGSTVLTMDPHMHDQVLGAVSHLPHVVAFSLVTALGEIAEGIHSEDDLLSYGGGGLRDTTRIAASSPEMWRDICLWNRRALVHMIETYERHLGRFKQLIESGDATGLEKEMQHAKQLRERVP